MKTERFNDLVKEIREASLDTLTKKNANYATAEDRLHNFKVGAAITGGTPAQAALGYMAKHLAARDEDNAARPSREEIYMMSEYTAARSRRVPFVDRKRR